MSARGQRDVAEAEISRLKAEKMAGRLIDQRATLRAVEGRARFERDSWIGWVNRAAPAVASEAGADLALVVAIFDREVRAQLAALAATPLEFPELNAETGSFSRRKLVRRPHSCFGRCRARRRPRADRRGLAPRPRGGAATQRLGMGRPSPRPADGERRARPVADRSGALPARNHGCLSTSSPVERIVFMKGAQTGGTEAALNAIGYWIAHAPGIILTVWPSIDMVRRNSRIRIEPLIDGTPALRAKIPPARSKDPGNAVAQKEFPGGALVMTGANSPAGLRSLPARYLVLDEVDAFPPDADGEGDPVALAVQRTVTFRGRRKIVLISTPTFAGASRIETAFAESDQRRFFVPCPHCGAMQLIAWASIVWPEGRPREAHMVCEANGCVIEERDKPKMLAGGEWRPTAAGDGRTAGFHLPALYSPFESWADIAAEFLAVRRDPLRLQPWTNTKLGVPFEDREGGQFEAAKVLERLEDWGDGLPEQAAVITAGVDVPGRPAGRRDRRLGPWRGKLEPRLQRAMGRSGEARRLAGARPRPLAPVRSSPRRRHAGQGRLRR